MLNDRENVEARAHRKSAPKLGQKGYGNHSPRPAPGQYYPNMEEESSPSHAKYSGNDIADEIGKGHAHAHGQGNSGRYHCQSGEQTLPSGAIPPHTAIPQSKDYLAES